jgi:cyclopropane-fatty-acyl-phospholipid synthase
MEAGLLGRFEERLRHLDPPPAVKLWDGRAVAALGEKARVTITLRSKKALLALLNPTLGKIARHYVEQEIDIEGDTREAARLCEALSSSPQAPRRWPIDLRSWLRHSRNYDRSAVQSHYDLNDRFFGLWLDRRRVYSCAYYRDAGDSLDLAQEQKLEHICRKLRLLPGERFLDIGCGWGALMFWAAQNYGVRATGITLSRNQYEYVSERIRRAGMEELCKVRLLDYRDLPEEKPFDKIASVGMFEHVGKKNLARYFRKIADLLAPGGLVLNHGITLNSLDQDELGSDAGRFIDEYVFPGGELVHISRVVAEMSGQGIECSDLESLRPHYARTLWHWVGRLEAQRERAVAEVGEKAFRIWRIYMAGAAHAFERGWMSIFQVLGGKARYDGRLELPETRDYIYRQ